METVAPLGGASPPAPVPLPLLPAPVPLLGVPVANATKLEAIRLMEAWIRARDGRSRSVFIVNAHTLNLAADDPTYREVLTSADVVFGDGTGVRWAARLRRVRMRDNLVGTDLIPEFIAGTLHRSYRYFMLGADPETAARARARLRNDYPGICIASHHHGYLGPSDRGRILRMINEAAPDMLLVAMGNPRQERWIHDHLADLRVPVAVGVGGLFDHWAGNLRRAPGWVRHLGVEWVQLLAQQPHKWRRYLLGNPKFVYRALLSAARGGAPLGSDRGADGGRPAAAGGGAPMRKPF